MEHPLRSEEDAITAAIEDHRRVYGMGDARTMAKVVLDRLMQHKLRKAAEAALLAPVPQSEPDWPEDVERQEPPNV